MIRNPIYRLMDEFPDTPTEAEIAADYLDDAERGVDTDWARWNDEANSDALVALFKTLNMSQGELGFEPLCNAGISAEIERIALCRQIIKDLMVNASIGHASRVIAYRKM